MNAIRGARERARAEITAAIKEEARRQLAEEGAARLSLRAVARELGMVSSALYRYFPSRDDLLTALIIDAYDAIGSTAERALAAADRDAPVARWRAVCRAVRQWALARPHEYALIYGSPVPGYSAPRSTVAPASRVGLALIVVVRDARAAGALGEPADGACAPAVPGPVTEDADRLTELLGLDLPAPVTARLIAAWAQLFGLIGFEVFGQFNQLVNAREEFFDHAVTRLAAAVGLTGSEGGS
ncbi:TetR/AcrR family transcriptional regulator [Streptomyces verrucosisporus]|uniref:TetR/AcrR family transcriptional regulator n=1 Tax=Streptomyces verrucosisporus TaxID=1695161 RepID=UPI0019CFCD61|nr:TetR/AcrR family transcriptional regulator [Streptomyces verrucosisporus]MBN3931346.1 TetR/AcrR family transcriptional regulator [Streptomyces verrucosisporus]